MIGNDNLAARIVHAVAGAKEALRPDKRKWGRSNAANLVGEIMLGLLLVSCGSRDLKQQGPADYVALGSSFAAGPGVGERAAGSPLMCARSQQNYAHQIAAKLGLRLRDLTCSGATVADILTERQAHQPPQIEGVDADARLVTLTIGGNDVSYLGNLGGESCANYRSKVPLLWRPIVCKVTAPDQVANAFAALPSRIGTAIDLVRERAPRARIVLVDYTTVLPASGSCPAIAPLTPSQVAAGNDIANRLSAITRRVAETKKVVFVAASRMTAGHDVCSQDPWVFGFVFRQVPLTWGPFSYHPNEKAMRAIADAVVASIRGSGSQTSDNRSSPKTPQVITGRP